MTPFNRPTEVKVLLVKGYISDIAPFSKLNTELIFDLLQQQKGYIGVCHLFTQQIF